MESYASIFKIFNKVKPHEFYHLASQSYVDYSFQDEFSTLSSNIASTHYCLSAIKESGLSKGKNLVFEDLRSNPNDPCFITGNIDEINQVFVNLLENAIKYSYQHSDIIVRVEQLLSDEVSVSVINKGEGIPEKYIDRLTERS